MDSIYPDYDKWLLSQSGSLDDNSYEGEKLTAYIEDNKLMLDDFFAVPEDMTPECLWCDKKDTLYDVSKLYGDGVYVCECCAEKTYL